MAEIILALDLPTAAAALAMVEAIPPSAWIKIGSVLFTAEGPSLVRRLKSRGHPIFLDLKWHDIPHTVEEAVRAARALEVDMVTVHTLGGPAMMTAAKKAGGARMTVVGVTVLTSHSETELGSILGRSGARADSEVERLARLGIDAGLDGVVASPLEVPRLRSALGSGPVIVTPGIRSASDVAGDQVRIASAGAAARSGASFLVVGRPVILASDPGRAWAALMAEVAAVS